ncbi:MAG: restriction endonuclease [Nitrososphaerota archaeon]
MIVKNDIPNDMTLNLLTTYLKLSREKVEPTIEEISENTLIVKELVEAYLREIFKNLDTLEKRRVKAAKTAILLGVEGERIAKYLDWKEFEELAVELFSEAGYRVIKNVKLKIDKNRIQIDLIECRDNVMLVVDCKHWNKPPAYSARRKIVVRQEERINQLSKIGGEVEVIMVPVVLTLYTPRELIVEGHPYVPIGKIRGFIEWFTNNYPFLKYFKARINPEKIFLHK